MGKNIPKDPANNEDNPFLEDEDFLEEEEHEEAEAPSEEELEEAPQPPPVAPKKPGKQATPKPVEEPPKKPVAAPVEQPKGQATLSPKDLPLTVKVEVAHIQMTAQKLLDLQAGNLLELSVRPENGVDLVINDKVVGKGELIRVGDVLGVRVLQIGS